jgi:tetratricopeptide (TPR) repeat protein
MRMTCEMNHKLLLPVLIILNFAWACGSKDQADDVQASVEKADSLSIKLNSPELKEINKQILENPADAELYHKRAKVYFGLHELTEAVNDSKRAIRFDSTRAEYYMQLVDAYFSQNNTRLAKDLLEIIEKKFPGNTEALLKLAELYWLVRQYQKGIDYVNKALKIDENLAKGYYIKGSIYRESGDTSRAISSLETATEQDNKYEYAYHDLGVIYAARKHPLGLQYFESALRLNPSNESALYGRARLLQDLGELDAAINEYRKISEINKACAECYYNIGAIYVELKKDNEKAIENFSRAIEINSEYPAAFFARGYTYAKMRNRSKAREDYQACLKLQPNHEGAIRGLNEL